MYRALVLARRTGNEKLAALLEQPAEAKEDNYPRAIYLKALHDAVEDYRPSRETIAGLLEVIGERKDEKGRTVPIGLLAKAISKYQDPEIINYLIEQGFEVGTKELKAALNLVSEEPKYKYLSLILPRLPRWEIIEEVFEDFYYFLNEVFGDEMNCQMMLVIWTRMTSEQQAYYLSSRSRVSLFFSRTTPEQAVEFFRLTHNKANSREHVHLSNLGSLAMNPLGKEVVTALMLDSRSQNIFFQARDRHTRTIIGAAFITGALPLIEFLCSLYPHGPKDAGVEPDYRYIHQAETIAYYLRLFSPQSSHSLSHSSSHSLVWLGDQSPKMWWIYCDLPEDTPWPITSIDSTPEELQKQVLDVKHNVQDALEDALGRNVASYMAAYVFGVPIRYRPPPDTIIVHNPLEIEQCLICDGSVNLNIFKCISCAATYNSSAGQ